MPYILESKRSQLDSEINQLVNVLKAQHLTDPTNDLGGNLNYTFTRILDALYGTKYRDMAAAVSVLEMAKLEFYRRVAAPYEDQKAFDNGDAFRTRN